MVREFCEPISSSDGQHSMNLVTMNSARRTVFLTGVCLVLNFCGCYNKRSDRVGYHSAGLGSVVDQDDYVYYPGFEVYYNNTRHQYVYQNGRTWVNRPQPPEAWARALSGSPYVHVDFHDAPERHHFETVRTYPKNWRPEQSGYANPAVDHKDDHHDDRRDDGRHDS